MLWRLLMSSQILLIEGIICMQSLKKELERVQRYQQPFSVMILLLDYFKNINDIYGHVAGDETLILIGSIQKTISWNRIYQASWGRGIYFLPGTKLEVGLN